MVRLDTRFIAGRGDNGGYSLKELPPSIGSSSVEVIVTTSIRRRLTEMRSFIVWRNRIVDVVTASARRRITEILLFVARALVRGRNLEEPRQDGQVPDWGQLEGDHVDREAFCSEG